jgi:hypothetical protein
MQVPINRWKQGPKLDISTSLPHDTLLLVSDPHFEWQGIRPSLKFFSAIILHISGFSPKTKLYNKFRSHLSYETHYVLEYIDQGMKVNN